MPLAKRSSTKVRALALAGVCLCGAGLVSRVARADGGGVITGQLESARPLAAGRAVVWIDGVLPGTWTLPKDTPKVSQRGARFQPDFLVLVAGQALPLPNDDRIVHNAFSVSPAKKFDMGHYRPGESQTVLFGQPGVVDVFCNIHENMHATIVVVPSTFFGVVDAKGRYRIADVPPGSYRLTAFAMGGQTVTTTVTVSSGAKAVRDLKLPGK